MRTLRHRISNHTVKSNRCHQQRHSAERAQHQHHHALRSQRLSGQLAHAHHKGDSLILIYIPNRPFRRLGDAVRVLRGANREAEDRRWNLRERQVNL